MTARVPCVLAALAALATVACAPTTGSPACDEPQYGGAGTDEAWRTMVDAEDDAATGGDAPSITSPEDGAAYAVDGAAPTFAWTSTLAGVLSPAQPTRVVARARRRASPLDALTALVVPPARAHKPPITGDVYYAKISVEGVDCPIAALTTDVEWALDADAWDALVAARGKATTFTVFSAYLIDNRVSEGPYASAPRAFTVE